MKNIDLHHTNWVEITGYDDVVDVWMGGGIPGSEVVNITVHLAENIHDTTNWRYLSVGRNEAGVHEDIEMIFDGLDRKIAYSNFWLKLNPEITAEVDAARKTRLLPGDVLETSVGNKEFYNMIKQLALVAK